MNAKHQSFLLWCPYISFYLLQRGKRKQLASPVGAQLGLHRSQGGLNWDHSAQTQKPLCMQEPREAEVYGTGVILLHFWGGWSV